MHTPSQPAFQRLPLAFIDWIDYWPLAIAIATLTAIADIDYIEIFQ